MTAAATQRAGGEWTALSEHDGVRVGTIARPRRVSVDDGPTALLREAVDLVTGTDDATAETRLEDLCPDPLVFALRAGLPRPAALGQQIDGGSEWRQYAPIKDAELVAVSSVAAIEERQTSSRRRLVRTVYLTEFHSAVDGQPVGQCLGISLDHEGNP